jgi:hypothetical protein
LKSTTRIPGFLGILLLASAVAAPALAQGTEHHKTHDMDAVGRALANPISDVWALFTEFDFTWSDGDLNDGDWKFGSDMIFQPVMPIKLTENWKLITRPSIPVVWDAKVPEPDGSGGADFDGKFGIGDMFLPLLAAPKATIKIGGGDIAWGLGPTWTFPTSTNDALGSEKWEVGPAGVLVWKNDKVTAGIFPQYWWSFASRDSDRDPTSHGVLLYFFWYNLPNAWQIGLAPTITYNHKASSGNEWNVPIGLMMAKTTKIGNRPVKFQFGVEYSVVSQDDFGKRLELKLNIIPVIAPLIKNPIF